jgi:hypothetical protein
MLPFAVGPTIWVALVFVYWLSRLEGLSGLVYEEDEVK